MPEKTHLKRITALEKMDVLTYHPFPKSGSNAKVRFWPKNEHL